MRSQADPLAGLANEPLQPSAARWIERAGGHLAVLDYDDARSLPDPRSAALEFCESTYRAGDFPAGWELARHACVNKATDPYASRGPPLHGQPSRPHHE